jgi:hypothetical protein
MMVYRPTVRYPNTYEKYVRELDESTHLDRNQIIRLALFMAAHSSEYQAILKKYKKADVILPQADWGRDEEGCWKNQNYIPKPKEEKKPLSVEPIKMINKGGIKYVPKAAPPLKKSVTL